MLTNSFSATATKFLDFCSKFENRKDLQVIDLSGVLSVLKHIKIDEQFAIAGLTPGYSGMGGSTAIYMLKSDTDLCLKECFLEEPLPEPGLWEAVRNEDEKEKLYQFGYFTVENSPEGFWDAFLLTEIRHFLPVYWHGGYSRYNMILDADNLLEIAEVSRKSVIRKLVTLQGDESLLPSVTPSAIGIGYDVSCHVWNDWSGLTRDDYHVSMTRNRMLKIKLLKVTPLVKYDCGIFF